MSMMNKRRLLLLLVVVVKHAERFSIANVLDTAKFDGYVADKAIRQEAVPVPDSDVNGGQWPVVS